jgi:glucoamylase
MVAFTGLMAVVAIRTVRGRRAVPRIRRRARRSRSRVGAWTFDHQFHAMPTGENLRVEVTSPAVVHWTIDQWDTAHDTRTAAENGLHAAELPTSALGSGTRIQFTFFWPDVNRWEGEDFEVRVEEGAVRYAT